MGVCVFHSVPMYASLCGLECVCVGHVYLCVMCLCVVMCVSLVVHMSNLCVCLLLTSSVQEMAVVYPDRVVTIQGTVDNMIAAQAAISLKLAECMEKDMHSASGVSMFVIDW